MKLCQKEKKHGKTEPKIFFIFAYVLKTVRSVTVLQIVVAIREIRGWTKKRVKDIMQDTIHDLLQAVLH